MPLLNGMAFIYEKAGGYINYGLCRGLGSAAYAVGSSLVGRIWASLGRTTLPVWCIAGALLTLVAILAMPDAPKAPESADKRREDSEESISMVQFFGKYRDVTLVVLALTLMYFCHFLIQTYLAKIIGTFETQGIEAIQGRALFIQAMVELPTMFGFALIMKRLGIPKILCIASVPMLYAAMVLQMFSYAAIIPATVYFSNEQVAEADRNKGQAVFAAASTAAMLLSSFIGGWLFQFLSVRLVVGFGAIVSIAGGALMFYGIQRCSKKRANQGVAKVSLKK
jgi:PPP family 3-phenylpropionic acid transporter